MTTHCVLRPDAWLFVALAASLSVGAALDPPAATVLLTVNGQPVTAADLELEYLSRRVPESLREETRDRLLEQIVDRRLMAAFLATRKAEAPAEELDAQVAFLRHVIEQGRGDFGQTLQRLGFTQQTLREHLSLPLAWKAHVRDIVTDQQLRDYFAAHRAELDGTEVRASQIVITVPAGSDDATWAAAERTLAELRVKIKAGMESFADAARQHSTSPSARQGGDLGFFRFQGRMPAAIATVAFSLAEGEISQPFRSSFGAHLVTVTDRRPGDLGLEDVRAEALEAVSRALWDDQVRQERAGAAIEWKVDRRTGS